MILQDKGDLPGAEALIRRAWEIMRHPHPKRTPIRTTAHRNLNAILRAQGKPEEPNENP
jgi:hypothetical protein